MKFNRVPKALRGSLLAVMLIAGIAGVDKPSTETPTLDVYTHAIATDPRTDNSVKLAMTLAWYYESSQKLRGKPYVDRLGKGKPWTVCNGITNAVMPIDPSHTYTAAECYDAERGLYAGYERDLQRLLPDWPRFTPWQQATFLDFVHHFGLTAFRGSTMYRLIQAGDVAAACRQHERWNVGTVNGVKKVLPGLTVRANSNADLCAP